jgi:hypothetical protein
MFSRQELRMRRVPGSIEAAEGRRRSNRWLLPHPISQGRIALPRRRPRLKINRTRDWAHVLAQAFDRLHAQPVPLPTPAAYAVDQDRRAGKIDNSNQDRYCDRPERAVL